MSYFSAMETFAGKSRTVSISAFSDAFTASLATFALAFCQGVYDLLNESGKVVPKKRLGPGLGPLLL
jgi:hypothetical protein